VNGGFILSEMKRDYDKEIEALEERIAKARQNLDTMEGELERLKQERDVQEYRNLIDFVKSSTFLTAEDAVEILRQYEKAEQK
jgi:Skp family chaperone for outer membrane proteins